MVWWYTKATQKRLLTHGFSRGTIASQMPIAASPIHNCSGSNMFLVFEHPGPQFLLVITHNLLIACVTLLHLHLLPSLNVSMSFLGWSTPPVQNPCREMGLGRSSDILWFRTPGSALAQSWWLVADARGTLWWDGHGNFPWRIMYYGLLAKMCWWCMSKSCFKGWIETINSRWCCRSLDCQGIWWHLFGGQETYRNPEIPFVFWRHPACSQ